MKAKISAVLMAVYLAICVGFCSAMVERSK